MQSAERSAIEAVPRWAADQASREPPQFFTVKPYDQDLGVYLFKYRHYSPDLCRWTTQDPSGFPDGANNFAYVNNGVTNAFDWQGLLSIKPGASTGNFTWGAGGGVLIDMEKYTAVTKKNNEIQVGKAIKYSLDGGTTWSSVIGPIQINGIPADFSSNCHGFVNLSGYWIDNPLLAVVLADEWIKTDEKNAKMVVLGGNQHSVTVSSHNADGTIKSVLGKGGWTLPETTSLSVQVSAFGAATYYE